MGVGSTNKRKGSTAERLYAKFFKEMGFEHCATSRFVSKKHDNAKIDLVYVPFNIQIKAGVQKNMNPGKELFSMASSIASMFPKEEDVHKKPCLLIHHKQGTMGVKRLPEMSMVYMSLLQFDLFKDKTPNLEYFMLKDFKFEFNSEFKTIVGMPFDYFKKEVILKQYVTCQ